MIFELIPPPPSFLSSTVYTGLSELDLIQSIMKSITRQYALTNHLLTQWIFTMFFAEYKWMGINHCYVVVVLLTSCFVYLPIWGAWILTKTSEISVWITRMLWSPQRQSNQHHLIDGPSCSCYNMTSWEETYSILNPSIGLVTFLMSYKCVDCCPLAVRTCTISCTEQGKQQALSMVGHLSQNYVQYGACLLILSISAGIGWGKG